MGDKREDVYTFGSECRTPSGCWSTTPRELFKGDAKYLVPTHSSFTLPEEFLR